MNEPYEFEVEVTGSVTYRIRSDAVGLSDMLSEPSLSSEWIEKHTPEYGPVEVTGITLVKAPWIL